MIFNINPVEAQVLYEISLSICPTTDVNNLLKNFMSTSLKKLNCFAGAVLLLTKDMNKSGLQKAFSIPFKIEKIPAYSEVLKLLSLNNSIRNKLPLVKNFSGNHVYMFDMPDTGFLVFMKNGEKLPFYIIHNIQSIAKKLSDACIFGIRINESEKMVKELKMFKNAILNIMEDMKATEEMLRQSQSRYRSISEQFNILLNSIGDSILLVDEELKIIWANNASASSLGTSKEQLEGRYCYELWFNKQMPCDNCYAIRSFSTGNIETERITTPDGRHFDTRAFPIKGNNGRVKNVIIVATDITEKLILEVEASKSARLASIGELAAGVAHEINNPINGIINAAQILLNKNKDAFVNDIASLIHKESERIATIVKSLLSFSRTDSSSKQYINIEHIITEVMNLTQSHIQKNNIRLEINIDRDIPSIKGNFQQIEQVFLNIINNAIYALNKKDKTEKILRINVTLDNKYLRITFYDNGIGIPEDIINRVMEPFFSTKSPNEGTGLGLSISHGIIKDHNGSIDIKSKKDEFTEIIIRLPYETKNTHSR